MYDRRTLVISSKDMEPTEYQTMRKAAKATGVGEGVISYARNNGRDILKHKISKIFP